MSQLTCTSEKSRNYSYGVLLGANTTRTKAQEYLEKHTVEGYYTLEAVYQTLQEKKEHVPILELIYQIAVLKSSPKELFTYLVEK